jgi:hypothetical protein
MVRMTATTDARRRNAPASIARFVHFQTMRRMRLPRETASTGGFDVEAFGFASGADSAVRTFLGRTPEGGVLILGGTGVSGTALRWVY